MLTPVATEGADYDPKQLVAGVEPGPAPSGPRQDSDLLEEQVLGAQVDAALQHRAEGTDEAEQLLKHRLRTVLPATHTCRIELLAPTVLFVPILVRLARAHA